MSTTAATTKASRSAQQHRRRHHDQCENEIRRLHQFFVDWFTAAMPNTDDEFNKGINNCLSPNFHLISPRGIIDDQLTLIRSLRKGYGIHNKDKKMDDDKDDSGYSGDSGNFQIDIKKLLF